VAALSHFSNDHMLQAILLPADERHSIPADIRVSASQGRNVLDQDLRRYIWTDKKRVPAKGGANDPNGDFKFRLGIVCCYNDHDAADIQSKEYLAPYYDD